MKNKKIANQLVICCGKNTKQTEKKLRAKNVDKNRKLRTEQKNKKKCCCFSFL